MFNCHEAVVGDTCDVESNEDEKFKMCMYRFNKAPADSIRTARFLRLSLSSDMKQFWKIHEIEIR